MKGMPAAKAILTLLTFLPVAILPASGRSALLSSQTSLLPARETAAISENEGTAPDHIRKMMKFLTPSEIDRLGRNAFMLCRGGSTSSPLEANETVAVILTLIMIGTMVLFVEQNR